jgi:hypothetical protein
MYVILLIVDKISTENQVRNEKYNQFEFRI